MGFIYIIRCNKTPKVYVGQTTEELICNRWKTHTYMGRQYTQMKENPELRKELNGGNSHIYNAMAHHGIENFYIEILEEVDNYILNDLEEAYIAEYDSIENGYNIRAGGNRTQHSEETKKLISQNTKAAFTNINTIKKMRKYSDKLEGLPVKCTYGTCNGRTCYRARRHPTVKDKVFYVNSFESEEACKNALKDYVENNRNPR